ncbi:MAG: hypothetical protein OXH31_06005 [Gammaproteobacteria bacterium]|nr:hypothetical protein [Gammaproteobacteria bacterium]
MSQDVDSSTPQTRINEEVEASKGPKIRVLSFSLLCITVLIVCGFGTRLYLKQELSIIYAILSVFFSINILICWWEACLFWQRTRVENRTSYWHERRVQTGKLPHVEFFATKIPLKQAFSSKTWADVWATYAQYDPSFADRRTYGFNVDIANGFVTLLPTLFLYATFTAPIVPAYVAGIVGLMLCWQWTYMTSVYWISFFVAKRHQSVPKRDLYLYIFGTNAPWLLCPLLGLFVSIRLIVDGNYSILG